MFVVRSSLRVVGCCSFLVCCLLFVALVRFGCHLSLLVEGYRIVVCWLFVVCCLLIVGCWLMAV